MSEKILVDGVMGQDGSHLVKYLLDNGKDVIGVTRRSGSSTTWRHDELKITGKFKIEYCDITEPHSVDKLIKTYQPKEYYHLAAQSFVKDSFDNPYSTVIPNAIGTMNILESIKNFSPHTRLYNASTSEMFGRVLEVPQTENTKFNPVSPYGVAKLFAHELIRVYRESYGMYACSGILFNHEGKLRGEEFVTRKITSNIAKWKAGKIKSFQLGNLDAKRDWGSAEDYVKGMVMMLQQEVPNDYILATNEDHSIRDFIQECFDYMHVEIYFHGKGKDEKVRCKATNETIISVNKDFYRENEVETLLGSYDKAKKFLGWEPTTTFKKLVVDMMKADLKREGVKSK